MPDALLDPACQSALVETAYAAALEPLRWVDFISALGASCESAVSFYLIPAGTPAVTQVLLASGHDAGELARYEAQHGHGNVLVDNLHRARGPAAVCRDLCPRRELQRSALYADWMRPQGFESAASVHLLNDDGEVLNMALMRRGRDGLFEAAHREALARLTPHLQRAATIARRLQRMESQQRWQDDLLHQLQLPLCLLAPDARLVAVNVPAQALMGRGRGLVAAHDRLRMADAADQHRFDLALARATGADGPARASDVALRAGPRPALRLTLSPTRGAGGPFEAAQPRALLLIADPQASPAPKESALRQCFDLSAAEAALALQLCQGLSVEQAAAARGVRVSTVRSQLHTLLQKTGAQRQSDLVRVMMTSVGLRLG
jgi:DNA-binding CsgD family transcriptional regulator